MNIIVDFFTKILLFFNTYTNNIILAIFLFTLISKIVLLPISIWVHYNSIKQVSLMPNINKIKIKYFGDEDKIGEEIQTLYKEEKYSPFVSIVPTIVQIFLLVCVIETIKSYSSIYIDRMIFFGLNLSSIPCENKGIYLLMPIIAALSSLLLCIYQNRNNVLQSEQSKLSIYLTSIVSIGISLVLGLFTQTAVVFYWIFSNIFAIVQQLLLNIVINPKKHVDYDELIKTKDELKEMLSLGKATNNKELRIREKNDYKRFFSIVNKHLVFYSESNGFYKYYKGIIEYLLNNTKIVIHYITGDPNDNIFNLSKNNSQIKAYYIGDKKLITLMMKMDADIVVMTMPDIDNYHIKRSYVRKEIEYIYMLHGTGSPNLMMRKGSMDNYDTIFSCGKHQTEEMFATEKYYNLKTRNIVKCGYPLLDDMRASYKELNKDNTKSNTILIAPSWQVDNIIDSCIDEIVSNLDNQGYKIIIRPHPQQVKYQRNKIDLLVDKYKDNSDVEVELDFSSNYTVFNADIVITDWSGIAYEYSFTTYKPVIFIDTPLKVMNPEYKNIDIEPFNIWVRDNIGKVIKPNQLDTISHEVQAILCSYNNYQEEIERLVNDYIYNLDNSAEVGANYIIDRMKTIIKNKKKNENK